MSKPTARKKPEKNMADKQSAIDKALKAMEEMEALKQAAVDELLEQRAEIDSKLQKLGYGVPAAAPKAPKAAGTRQRDPNKPCSVCNFVTVPAHDGRVHRSQGEKKKPFTDAELNTLGLKRA